MSLESLVASVSSLLVEIKKEETLTQEFIREKVALFINIHPSWADIDPDEAVRELETRFNVYIGRPRWLEDNTDHEAWLDAEKEKIEWRLWKRYREYLNRQGYPFEAINSIDETTDRILGNLESPRRNGSWDRRGLVVGHVQSGKTGNFIGLANKAADAGYKIIIVLAGIHNNLRAQTQIRVDEGILGYESLPSQAEVQRVKAVGVGDISPTPRPSCFTHRGQHGDFKNYKSYTVGEGKEATLLVVKKNASVLKNLLKWADFLSNRDDTEFKRKVVDGIPLLIIDDEADQASVDTKEQTFNEKGEPDEEHNPTTINRRIRQLLRFFSQSAYVGYTATPFANIFIHNQGSTKQEGEDLFPRSFIVNLPTPSNYDGPEKIFGTGSDNQPLPLIRVVSDDSNPAHQNGGWMPKHKSDHIPLVDGMCRLPDSLEEAILAFLLTCAAREIRGQIKKNKSMLIHVTRFTKVQAIVTKQVKKFLATIQDKLRHGEGAVKHTLRSKLRKIWEEDFQQTTIQYNNIRAGNRDHFQREDSHPWEVIDEIISAVSQKIHVFEINGRAKDILDYDKFCKQHLYVIAVGGDKLSRGLTLDGLSVSYFLRASKMYDTLMQMGRWFGYRKGYLDLCRLYTTDQINRWFQYITEASEELRDSFNHMATIGETPEKYGLRVLRHPTLLVTSPVKMRSGKRLKISFGGSSVETVLFRKDLEAINMNFQGCINLCNSLPEPIIAPEVERLKGKALWKNALLWTSVSSDPIIKFLEEYQTHDEALKVNTELISRYIKIQNERGELTNWTVGFMGGQSQKTVSIAGQNIPWIQRTMKREHSGQKRPFVIGRLLSPRDEAIDLSRNAYDNALNSTIRSWKESQSRKSEKEPTLPTGPWIRSLRVPANALLLLYPIELKRKDEEASVNPDQNVPIPGFGISFPESPSANAVEYEVNKVFDDDLRGFFDDDMD